PSLPSSTLFPYTTLFRSCQERRKLMKTNDVILQTGSKVLFFIILLFAVYIFFAGHNSPGGGFVGGLLTTGAFVLLLLAYDLKTVDRKSTRLNSSHVSISY